MKSYKLKYYANAGKTAQLEGKTGIICGWDDDTDDCSLIMAVKDGKGWPVPFLPNFGMHIITDKDNAKGYYFVQEKDLIKTK